MATNRKALLMFFLIVSGVCISAWYLPEGKGGAVAGRLTYWQLILFLVSAAISASLAGLLLSPGRWLRPLTFRVLAVGLATTATVFTWEIGAFLWPTRHLMDNPWYLATGEGLESDDELRFVRSPYLKWRGLSQGNLAMKAGDRDPLARVVTFQTDFEGFRNSTDLDKADWVFIGDSFTEAGNLPEDETFVARVASQLGVVARNLGRAGYSPAPELVVLREFGLKNDPNVVVWQITEANDLHNAVIYEEWLKGGRKDFRREPRGRPTRKDAWKRRSPSYRFFDMVRTPSDWPLSGTFRDSKNNIVEMRFIPRLPSSMHRPRTHPGWPMIVKALREGDRILRRNEIELLVILIPMKLRVMGPYTNFSETEIDVDGTIRYISGKLPDGWDLPSKELLSFHLRELCEKIGVKFIDATNVLREHAAAGELVYLPMDTHLSSRGHEIVSEMIVNTAASPATPH